MNVITVSQVNTYIKAIIDENAILRNIFIIGEISNFVHYYRSGHMYFTLKDEKGQLKCVMFSSSASRLKFKPEDGMRVICRGRISVYDKDGIYQLYVEDMQPDGVGALNLAYEQLKNKLEAEGLFDDIYKKPIPSYPKKIGVATSDIGAAVEDIKNITKRRFPLCELIIVPTIVQGDAASADIVRSINILDNMGDIDLIIVGRGGGSIEDLWAFNTEPVARAVFECNKPIISAVGHETDYTICDFVADLRAPTPSAAAEIAVPNASEILDRLASYSNSLNSLLNHKLSLELQRLDSIIENSILSKPMDYISSKLDVIDEIKSDLNNSFSSIIIKKQYELSSIAGKLNALSPLSIISRGFGLVEKDGKLVNRVDQVSSNDNISIKLSDGTINCEVKEVIKNG